LLVFLSSYDHDVLIILPENTELIKIQTTVLNAVRRKNYGDHNFFHLERKNVQHGTLEKKKNHTEMPQEHQGYTQLPRQFILLHNTPSHTDIPATTNCHTFQIFPTTKKHDFSLLSEKKNLYHRIGTAFSQGQHV
jgi:hypothetical protein